MARRYYRLDSSEFGVGLILLECFTTGSSSGWCSNSIDELLTVKQILAPLGIHYVDDMYGRWEPAADSPMARTRDLLAAGVG